MERVNARGALGDAQSGCQGWCSPTGWTGTSVQVQATGCVGGAGLCEKDRGRGFS